MHTHTRAQALLPRLPQQGGGRRTAAVLSLIDLAGSESAKVGPRTCCARHIVDVQVSKKRTSSGLHDSSLSWWGALRRIDA
eukprot:1153081-Pelagomonas_calceolata.AAC.2